MPAPINFTEWMIPDSNLTKKATQLVAEVSPEFLYNHCIRTYLFSEALGQRDRLKYDRELLYLSAVMHDLGITKYFMGAQRFEVDGADVARPKNYGPIYRKYKGEATGRYFHLASRSR